MNYKMDFTNIKRLSGIFRLIRVFYPVFTVFMAQPLTFLENLAGHYHDLLARNYYRRVALDRQLDPELRAELGIENMMIEDPPGYPVVPGIIPQRIKPQVVEPARKLNCKDRIHKK